MKPLYTLNAIELLIRYALNYAMATKDFSVECRAEEGFKITYHNNDMDFFQVVNTCTSVLVFIRPTITVQTEFTFDRIDNNIYAFKESFDSWIRCLYEKQKKSSAEIAQVANDEVHH